MRLLQLQGDTSPWVLVQRHIDFFQRKGSTVARMLWCNKSKLCNLVRLLELARMFMDASLWNH